MKRIIFLTIFLISIPLIIGCENTENAIPKGEFVGMVKVDDSIWVYTGDEVSVSIDEIEIIGEITSTVKYYEIPIENGQANFEIIGSKYARYEDDIVVLIDNGWILFTNEEDWRKGISIQYDESMEKEIFGDLSEEQIFKLLGDMTRKIIRDKNYENNLDSIIEDTFIEYGIEDSSNLEYAKKYLLITVANSE